MAAAAEQDATDQLQEGEEEVEEVYEPTEEELEQQRIEQENAQLEENFDAYASLDADEESKKLQEKELAKNNKKKAVSVLFQIFTYRVRGAA